MEERAREIALTEKTKELEAVEAARMQAAVEKEKAAHELESVRVVADAEREKELERIESEKAALARRIDEENKAEVTKMHMLTQAEARRAAAEQESKATVLRAEATSEAQKITAEGIEREAGARGRAEMEIENLRAENTRRVLEAEASGLEAKADALKKYNDAATFLELAKLQIEADRDVHIDQAKAMGNALSQAQIRMYGGGDGTVDTIRGMFTQGFALGEILEGAAQSLPDGLRQRFASNGIRGIFGRPYGKGQWKSMVEHLTSLVGENLRTKKDRQIPFNEALALLDDKAGEDATLQDAVSIPKDGERGRGLRRRAVRQCLVAAAIGRQGRGLSVRRDSICPTTTSSWSMSTRPFRVASRRSSILTPRSNMASSSPYWVRAAAAKPRRCA